MVIRESRVIQGVSSEDAKVQVARELQIKTYIIEEYAPEPRSSKEPVSASPLTRLDCLVQSFSIFLVVCDWCSTPASSLKVDHELSALLGALVICESGA